MEAEYPKLALQSTNGLLFVRQQEVLYAIASGNYTFIHLNQNRKIKVVRKLKEIGHLLSGDCFIRIHNSFLINLEHIMIFDQNDSGRVVMSDGRELEVSRNRKAVFLEKFTCI